MAKLHVPLGMMLRATQCVDEQMVNAVLLLHNEPTLAATKMAVSAEHVAPRTRRCSHAASRTALSASQVAVQVPGMGATQ